MRRWFALSGVALLVLSLAMLPGPAAGADFTLGGQINMYTIWDSTQVNANLTQYIWRNNHATNQHGRLKFSAEKSRLWFLIKGPKLWGATTTGFIEFDFDNSGNEYIMTGTPGGGWASPHKARLGLRHAFFRLNWPETELLMGHYWSLVTEDVPDIANPGSGALWGNPYIREPQIRLSQKFLGVFEAAIAICQPMNGQNGTTIATEQNALGNPYMGESSETPRVTARLRYEQDLWGKAPYYGKPRAFTLRVATSWERTRFQRNTAALAGQIFGQNNFVAANVIQRDQQYLNQWLVEGSMFVPIIPTNTPNLAGTLSLLTQWYIGAGVDNVAEETPANSSYLNTYFFDGANWWGDRQLMQRWGGYVQLQYYFTNEWYMNAVYTTNRAMGVDLNRWAGLTNAADPVHANQAYYLTLWYQPIKAIKFGLEYVYSRTDYFQRTTVQTTNTSIGEDHRMMFTGFFYF